VDQTSLSEVKVSVLTFPVLREHHRCSVNSFKNDLEPMRKFSGLLGPLGLLRLFYTLYKLVVLTLASPVLSIRLQSRCDLTWYVIQCITILITGKRTQ